MNSKDNSNIDIVINKATPSDIEFISDTIVSAEKSGTNNFGLANLFGLDEKTMKGYIADMLDEEIDGCEFSLSSFLVARYKEKPVAAFAGWIEGKNEDNKPSSILKSNLIACALPYDVLLKSRDNADVVKPLQIEREKGVYQLEYSYTLPEYRGQNIMSSIIKEHFHQAVLAGIRRVQVHVFANNDSAIKTYEKCGFVIKQEFHTENPLINKFSPYNKILLMEKELLIIK